jgi:hypothetical protein
MKTELGFTDQRPTERTDVEQVVVDIRIMAHHALLAARERVPMAVLAMFISTRTSTPARALRQQRRHFQTDRIAKEPEYRQVDLAARRREIGQQRRQDAMARPFAPQRGGHGRMLSKAVNAAAP